MPGANANNALDNDKNNPLKMLQNPGSMLNSLTDPFKNPGETIKSKIDGATDPDKMKGMVTPDINFKNPFDDLLKSSKQFDKSSKTYSAKMIMLIFTIKLLIL